MQKLYLTAWQLTSTLSPHLTLRKLPLLKIKLCATRGKRDEELPLLGADTKSETAGPLITFLMARGASRCRVPSTVVPGNLTDEQLDALF